MRDESGRAVLGHVQFAGIVIRLLLGRILAQQEKSASGHEATLGRDDGIDQDLEIRTGLGRVMDRGAGRQVTAGRAAHDTELLDPPLRGAAAHQFDGAVGVVEGHVAMSVRHSVFQHGERDAQAVEPVGHIRPLVRGSHVIVAAARTHDHGQAVRLLGREDQQLGIGDVADTAAEHRALGTFEAVAVRSAVRPQFHGDVGRLLSPRPALPAGGPLPPALGRILRQDKDRDHYHNQKQDDSLHSCGHQLSCSV